MSVRRICSRCGCSSFHYNSRALRVLCDQCGHPFEDPVLDQQQQSYDRIIKLAREHLRVGNWIDCKNLIKPLCHQKPSDPQLYLILLASVTQGYNHYLFENIHEQNEAATYWEKLMCLHSVNNVMRDYANRRKVAKLTELKNKRNTIFTLLYSCVIALLFSAILTALLAKIISFSISCFILWRLFKFHTPQKTLIDLHNQRNSQNENPFI